MYTSKALTTLVYCAYKMDKLQHNCIHHHTHSDNIRYTFQTHTYRHACRLVTYYFFTSEH